MKSPAFDYERPRDVAEAVKLLSVEGAKAAAGTQSLGPMLNLRIAHPTLLVDLRGIDELRFVSQHQDAVTIGACSTHAEIEDGRVQDPTRGLMATVAANISYRAVRNRGTIGGSLAHADPAADWPTALTLLDAIAIIASPRGRREVPVERFVTGIFSTALEPDELLVAIRIPKRSASARYGYWKFCRKAGEFAQAIGAALHDPERQETRAVIGAIDGPPHLMKTLEITDEALRAVGNDAYSRQLHRIALKRAVAQVSQS
jgi:aerobic carbon-monoxide dehydrogenase medium subunit